MKLSKSTLDILKNFSNINQSICFKEGTELSTLSIQKNILSRAVVEEQFPKNFAIYDLSEFLSGLTLFDDPEFSFDNDNYVIIKDKKNSSRYFFADPSTIVTPPENRVELPSKDVCFTVAWSDISNVIKAASIYQIEDLAVVGDGATIKLVVRDKKNDTSNSYAVEVGRTDKNFSFNFKVENLKLLPGNYEVVISKSNASLFRDANKDLEYLIALGLILSMKDDFLWVEKYRPTHIEHCILPKDIKDTFQSFVKKGEVPNLLLCGTAGIGKTTIAKALCNEIGVDSYMINGSDEGRFLDTVRNSAKQFASTVSLTSASKHKVIIIDEADNTTHDVQLLLRASIEEFQKNCRFIFTCNFKNKIIEPLHSRTTVIDCNVRGKNKQQLAAQFFERCRGILTSENVQFDNAVVAEVVQKYFPDFRRTLNELQRYSASGSIDTGILAVLNEVRLGELVSALKKKEFSIVRKWIVSNLDNDPNAILRTVYDSLYDSLVPTSIPQAVLIISKYQYQSAFVADQEINLLAALTEIMVECEFK